MRTPKQISGIHGPNRRLYDLPHGPADFIDELDAAGVTWTRLLYPDHDVASARLLHNLGYKIILRAPGEGYPQPHVISSMIKDYTGIIDVLECGNEPPLDVTHLLWMEDVLNICLWQAKQAGIVLCAPGWNSSAEPPYPWASVAEHPLSLRMWNLYMRFDAIACHCYGSVNFAGQLERAGRWQAVFYNKPLYITEAGIAAKDLIPPGNNNDHWEASMPIKAARYADLTARAAAMGVQACCFFISQFSTDGWLSFDVPNVYDPNGHNSFKLDNAAWARFAATLNPQ